LEVGLADGGRTRTRPFSDLAALQALDQAGEHSRRFLETVFENGVHFRSEHASPSGRLQERLALLDGTPRDPEEIAPVCGGEPPVAFGKIRGDGESRAVELVAEEAVPALELFSSGADVVGEVGGFLIDEQLFEAERHGRGS
jgi:hypothetical protein